MFQCSAEFRLSTSFRSNFAKELNGIHLIIHIPCQTNNHKKKLNYTDRRYHQLQSWLYKSTHRTEKSHSKISYPFLSEFLLKQLGQYFLLKKC